MIVTCPGCSKQYRIAAGSVGSNGRTVRCAGCGHSWFVPSLAVPALVPPPILEPAMAVTEPEVPSLTPPPFSSRSRRAPLGWLVLALVLLGLAAAALGRNEIVAAVPEALPLYERLGLSNAEDIGLEFRNVATSRPGVAGDAVVIAGEIHNVADSERPVPAIRVGLLDDGGQELADHRVDPPQDILPAAGFVRFEVRLAAAPPDARRIAVTFSARH